MRNKSRSFDCCSLNVHRSAKDLEPQLQSPTAASDLTHGSNHKAAA
jgi:hypothetical protein